MARVDAHRHAGQPPDRGNLGKIHEIAMRIAEVGLHAAQPEDNVVVALAGQIFRSVQRLVERDAKTTLDQYRKLLLTTNDFQQLEILRVARADLQHYSCRVARVAQRLSYLLHVRFVGDFHGDDAYAMFAGQFEYIRQTTLAVTLERVRAGAWLVSTHAGALLAVFLQRAHHDIDMFAGVHRAKAGKNMQRVLAKAQTMIIEID